MAELEQTTTCPHCMRVNELHTNTTGRRPPRDGDVSVCFGCHRPALYVAGPFGVTLRRPTAVEALELDADPRFRQAVAALRRVGGES